MKTFRKPLTAIMVTAALSSTVMGSTAANAEIVPNTDSAQKGKHCRIVLAKLKPGEKVSRVVSETCADKRADLGASAGTLLVIFYQHEGWWGHSYDIEGAEGPCDFWGYGFDTGFNIDHNATSFKVYNNCNKTRAYTDTGFGGTEQTYWGNVANVGSVMNDNIGSVRLSSGSA